MARMGPGAVGPLDGCLVPRARLQVPTYVYVVSIVLMFKLIQLNCYIIKLPRSQLPPMLLRDPFRDELVVPIGLHMFFM